MFILCFGLFSAGLCDEILIKNNVNITYALQNGNKLAAIFVLIMALLHVTNIKVQNEKNEQEEE
jgi:hypothetical protein